MKNYYENIQAIKNYPAPSAWDKGVRGYALTLYRQFLQHQSEEKRNWNEIPSEKDLLFGAKDWHQFSNGACAEVASYTICKRLCTKSQQKRFRNGLREPSSKYDWVDIQADALKEAAQIVLMITRED